MRASSTSPRAGKTGDVVRDVNRNVARRLKLLRVLKGRTQTDLGRAVGLTPQQMAKYETGVSKIAPGMLWKLAEYFEVDVGYFFEDPTHDLPGIDLRLTERQAAQKRLRIELISALDAIADDRLLRCLRVFLRASHGQDCDE
jgi:transcriptional regulator with XRE-family HTH domain